MASMDRRDFLKRTGGTVASTALPGMGAVGRAASGVMGAAKGFTPSPTFLMMYISKMSDIPYNSYDNKFFLDANALMDFMGIKPKWKNKPGGVGSTNEILLDPEDVFDKVLKSTGDKAFVAQMRDYYGEQLKKGKLPGNAIYKVLWKSLGGSVSDGAVKEALGKFIAQKGYSAASISKHAGHLGRNSIEILRGIIKSSGGPANIFKMDMRELRETWRAMPDMVKRGMSLKSIEDLERLYRHKTLTDVCNFPNVHEVLNLPEWLVDSVRKGYGHDSFDHPINQDVKDYIDDWIKDGRAKADAQLTRRYTPKTSTLGHWDREGKRLGALNPGGSFGRYSSESIHCFTGGYKLLIEELLFEGE